MSADRPQKRSWRDFVRGVLGAAYADDSRRKWLVRIGIAAAAIALFVLAPGYIATQPGFLRRYPAYERPYQTWTKSVHAQAACQSCHVGPNAVARTAFGARMTGEFYLSLLPVSRNPKLLRTPSNDACASCHIDLRTVSPSGDLNIPHRAHVDVLKIPCIKCHAFLVHEKNPEGTNSPRMETCLVCHDGTKAKNQCTACHNNKGAPESHRKGDWLIVHPTKQGVIDCKKCHNWTEDWCAKCHARRPRSHGADWRAAHPVKVKQHRNCEACHKGDFCVRCHGERPKLNFDPSLKLVQ